MSLTTRNSIVGATTSSSSSSCDCTIANRRRRRKRKRSDGTAVLLLDVPSESHHHRPRTWFRWILASTTTIYLLLLLIMMAISQTNSFLDAATVHSLQHYSLVSSSSASSCLPRRRSMVDSKDDYDGFSLHCHRMRQRRRRSTVCCAKNPNEDEEKEWEDTPSQSKKDSTESFVSFDRRRPLDVNATTVKNTPTTVPSAIELQFMQRVLQLEQLVAAQQVQIRQLSNQVSSLAATADNFASVMAFIREALAQNATSSDGATLKSTTINSNHSSSSSAPAVVLTADSTDPRSLFGTAPATVMDAADAAGAAILAGLLAGKQRMLVDVRDAELSFATPQHSETLVQFIELAILPVAAGLEGLRSRRNRLKVVFPTVSHLLTYRKSMALSAPDVVALSTLGFDPVEQKDNLVVILVPSPEDDEGLTAMNELLNSQSITQPVVVINHHMVPVAGPAATFEVAYHLRLLSVQYMAGDSLPPEEAKTTTAKLDQNGDLIVDDEYDGEGGDDDMDALFSEDDIRIMEGNATPSVILLGDNSCPNVSSSAEVENDDPSAIALPPTSLLDDAVHGTEDTSNRRRDAEVEAAVQHAHAVGLHHGTTRAMVIRAYPRAWHVFVDTSPDTDADFEVAAIFADEPHIDQVNAAIIECIEGSELEDELVAQQMQQALEAGQLDRVSELLASMGLDDLDDDDDDDDDPYRSMFGEDTV